MSVIETIKTNLNQIQIHEILVAAFKDVTLTVKSKAAMLKHLKDNYAGQYDGKVAAEVIKLMINIDSTTQTPKENTMSVQTIVAEVKEEFKAVVDAVEAGLEKLNPFATKVEAEVEAKAAPVVAEVQAKVEAVAAPVVAEVQAKVATAVAGTEAKIVAAAGDAASAAVEKAVTSVLPKA
jgi:ElaB/YqjD/DUF883 family membrane-anchored ribosome-binding protein